MANAPQIDPSLVRDFVANSHGDIERVRVLLEEQPALINAAWDWGGGDWETGLGAAAQEVVGVDVVDDGHLMAAAGQGVGQALDADGVAPEVVRGVEGGDHAKAERPGGCHAPRP